MSVKVVYAFSADESLGITPRQAAERFVNIAFEGQRKVESMSEDGYSAFVLDNGTCRYQAVLIPTAGAGYSHYEIWMRNDVVFCQSCKAHIVFLLTAKGKKIPVNAETVNPQDSMYDPQAHVSHFATCPDAKKFRKKGGQSAKLHPRDSSP